jgi:hypothetical protein
MEAYRKAVKALEEEVGARQEEYLQQLREQQQKSGQVRQGAGVDKHAGHVLGRPCLGYQARR